MMQRGGVLLTAVLFGAVLVACGSTSNGADASNGAHGGSGALGGADGAGGSQAGGASNGGSGNASGAAGNSASGSPGGCAAHARGTWLPMSAARAPAPRAGAWAIATGDGLLVWKGSGPASPNFGGVRFMDGGIYDVCADSWTPMRDAPASTTAGAALATTSLATWTGSGLIVWGGIDNALVAGGYPEGKRPLAASVYDARTDTWKEMSRQGEPTARELEWRVWTGKELLVWGGIAQSGDKSWVNHADGALYDPARDEWRPMSAANAPSGRGTVYHSVWTGSQFIVWGGLRYDPGPGFIPAYNGVTDGAVYDVASDRWSSMATAGAPKNSSCEVAWTGSRLLVLCMLDGFMAPGTLAFDGAQFDPSTNTWSKMSRPDAALVGPFLWGDGNRKTLWAGDALVVVGERIDPTTREVSFLALVYDPVADAWRVKALPRTPANGSWQYAEVVAGKVVYAGSGPPLKDATGSNHFTTELALFDPRAMTSTALPLVPDRVAAAPVVARGKVLVWGGQDTFTELGTPPPCATPTMPACDPITPMRTVLRGDGLLLAPE